MDPPEFLEYPVLLRTGETVKISELDPGRTPWGPEADAAARAVLDRCTRATREEMEAAKSGDTKHLEARLGTPPHGCLLKVDMLCSEHRSCPSADLRECRTSCQPSKKKPGGFPMCWNAPAAGSDPSSASALMTAIVMAWRDGRTVVIVDDEIGPPRRAPR